MYNVNTLPAFSVAETAGCHAVWVVCALQSVLKLCLVLQQCVNLIINRCQLRVDLGRGEDEGCEDEGCEDEG